MSVNNRHLWPVLSREERDQIIGYCQEVIDQKMVDTPNHIALMKYEATVRRLENLLRGCLPEIRYQASGQNISTELLSEIETALGIVEE